MFELRALPARLVVLGAGPVGVELAQAFQRLGSQVTLVDHHDRLASVADAEASGILQAALARDGVTFRLQVLAAKVMVALARQALRLEQQLEQLAFQEVPVRLAQAVVQLAEDNGGELPANLTHEALAKLIRSTRETVSKTLEHFAGEGFVELGYRRIRVLNWAGLRQVARIDDGQPAS